MNMLKTVIYKTYVIALIAFVIYAAKFIYPLIYGFEDNNLLTKELHKLTGSESEEEKLSKIRSNINQLKASTTHDLGYKVIKQQYIKKHFHHIGFEIQKDNVNACVFCHSQAPHEKDKETRSFLNMHAFSVACESCHAVEDKSKSGWTFGWYDVNDGNITSNPGILVEENIFTGPFNDKNKKYYPTGNYGAKVAPGYLVNGKFQLLTTAEDLKIAQNYMLDHKDMLGSERKKAKKMMHKTVSDKALECDACHGDHKRYIPYAKLGYPPRRVRALNDSAIVGLISKYERFYFPNFMDGSGRRK